MIPAAADQPGFSTYNPNDPVDYAPEADLPDNYPTNGDANFPTGIDPTWSGLSSAYGSQLYQMHWLLDVDNWYKYGKRGDQTSRCGFGMQFWGMDRMIEYYYVSGDAKAKAICDKWITWVLSQSSATATGFSIPSDLSWSGQLDPFTPGTVPTNANLRCTVSTKTTSYVGTAAGLAKCLIYYAAAYKKFTGTAHAASQTLAANILDSIWANKTAIGCTVPEDRADYDRFTSQVVYIPSGINATNGQGAQIRTGVTFDKEIGFIITNAGTNVISMIQFNTNITRQNLISYHI